jgi:CMP/dCMP kinase
MGGRLSKAKAGTRSRSPQTAFHDAALRLSGEPMTENRIIAVDGPAASGKGTIARALARHFGFPHLDTGLLYRAVGLNLLRWGGDPESEFAALRACDFSQIDFGDPELKSEAVGGVASRISAYPAVRAALVERQRDFASQTGGAVLDGRDIGTVIAPEAAAKLFVTATPEIRARRRFEELSRMGLAVHYEDVLIDIRARDERDSNRAAAPLRAAADAHRLDTSDMGIEAAVAEAIAVAEGKIGVTAG